MEYRPIMIYYNWSILSIIYDYRPIIEGGFL